MLNPKGQRPTKPGLARSPGLSKQDAKRLCPNHPTPEKSKRTQDAPPRQLVASVFSYFDASPASPESQNSRSTG